MRIVSCRITTSIKVAKATKKDFEIVQGRVNSHYMFLVACGREISIQGEGGHQLVQLSINFKHSCWRRKKKKLCFSKQLIEKLIDNCTSGSAPSRCIEISLPVADVCYNKIIF